jgi:hypothetical protein
MGLLSKPSGTTSPITFGGLKTSATTSNFFGGTPAAPQTAGFGFGQLGQQQQQQQQQQAPFGSTGFGTGGFGAPSTASTGFSLGGFGQTQQPQTGGTGNPPFAPVQVNLR